MARIAGLGLAVVRLGLDAFWHQRRNFLGGAQGSGCSLRHHQGRAVHCVSNGVVAPAPRVTDNPDQRCAPSQPDAHLHRCTASLLKQIGRRLEGAQCVVLMRDGRPEDTGNIGSLGVRVDVKDSAAARLDRPLGLSNCACRTAF